MKKAISLEQAVELITQIDDDELEETELVDIVELPPECVDNVSDCEAIDDDDLSPEQNLRDTAGKLEVHLHGNMLIDSSVETSTQRKKKAVADWILDQTSPDPQIIPSYDNTQELLNLRESLYDRTPFEIFSLMTNELYEKIRDETLAYARQQNDMTFQCTVTDIKVFVGILILSGHRSYPRESLYWSTDENFECAIVRNAMSRNRYKDIKKYLHFNNNNDIPDGCTDRCYKIRPLVDLFNKNFQQFGYFGCHYSVDEKIVEYFGKHPMKQFIRGKPIRFGFKEWALCDVSGYTYKFEIYQGRDETVKEEYKNWNLGAKVVLSMTEYCPVGSEIYFDNFFTDLSLMQELSRRKLCATGTVRMNRIPNCPLTSKNEWKKKEKGQTEVGVDRKTGILALGWKDNNVVTVLSNSFGKYPTTAVKRRVKGMATTVQMPNVLRRYNNGMSGVDLSDWKTQRYRISIKGKKWYFCLFSHMLDVAIVNSHELYKLIDHSDNKMDLLAFRIFITSSLLREQGSVQPKIFKGMKGNKFPRIAALQTNVQHNIQRTTNGKQRRCAVCSKTVRKECLLCDRGLHVECFSQWHRK